MPECHHCKWNDAPPTPGKEAACLNCFLPPDRVNHKGKIWVSLDAGDKQTFAEVEAARRVGRRDDAEEEAPLDLDDPLIEEAMELGALRILHYLMDLDPAELSMLMMALAQPLAETARQINRTRQAVSASFRNVVARHPELDVILHADRRGYLSRPANNARAQGRP